MRAHLSRHSSKYLLTLIIVIASVTVGLGYSLDQEYQIKFTQLDNQNIALSASINSLSEQLGLTASELKSSIEGVESDLASTSESLAELSAVSGDFSGIIEDAVRGVVSVLTDNGQGSGVVYSDDGYIITNYHVIQNANEISILFSNGRTVDAVFLGADTINDVALLKVEMTGLYELDFDESEVRIGEKVIAMGNPLGLSFSVTEGIVSAKGRIIKRGSAGLIQIDAPVNPGNSGGPLLNTQGNVVGIVNAKLQGYEGIGFAIPSAVVVSDIDLILEQIAAQSESA
jgi:S1-C subfamily serine protease